LRKVKILRIIARLNIGGPAIHTILLSRELNRIGYHTILVKGSEGQTEGNMIDLAEAKGVKPVVIPELGREIGFKNDLIALYKIYKLIKKEKPDIVHTHTAKAGTLGRVAAWIARVPVILHTFHGHVLTGYFGRVKSWVFVQIEKLLARTSTKVITLSDELKRELIDMGIGDVRKIEVVPLGLELKQFFENEKHRGEFKKELGLPEDTLLVSIIGRLVQIKGHVYFLETAKRVSSESGVQSPVKFLIVGDGELREELEEYAKELDIVNSVIFTGFRKDLSRIYADIDILMLTSINEGTPVSIIEAMASGKPVIATGVGGVPSLVKDGINGFMVKPGDINALSDATIRLLKDPELRVKMGKEGQRIVYPYYDISELVERVDHLYKQIITEKKNTD
jgi:glycosyltransferase involved in cell wall biosynthesis